MTCPSTMPRTSLLGGLIPLFGFVVLLVLLCCSWARTMDLLKIALIQTSRVAFQIWVKTPEVLARDRLLGSFSVKPVLSRVKLTLVGLAVSLVLSVLLFINVENSRDPYKTAGERAVAGVYNDASARSFEPDVFCGEPDLA